MIWIAIYLFAALLDYLTSARILKRPNTLKETNPIVVRLFGTRPTVLEFTILAVAKTAITVGVLIWLQLEWLVMFMAVPWHLKGAISNYRLEKKQ